MRFARVLLIASPVLLVACAEQPRCVDRGTPERPRVVMECNAGKVPVCGNDPAQLYDQNGALLRVPPDSVANGSCDDFPCRRRLLADGSEVCEPICRPRPLCTQAGSPVTCANGAAPFCVLGDVETIPPPTPDSGPGTPDSGPGTPDSGPPPEEDAGPVEVDAGSEADGG